MILLSFQHLSLDMELINRNMLAHKKKREETTGEEIKKKAPTPTWISVGIIVAIGGGKCQ